MTEFMPIKVKLCRLYLDINRNHDSHIMASNVIINNPTCWQFHYSLSPFSVRFVYLSSDFPMLLFRANQEDVRA